MEGNEGGGTSCLENEFDYPQLMVLLLKGILMMLQQRKVESEMPLHKDLGVAMPYLERDQHPSYSLLLFPVNRNENQWSWLRQKKLMQLLWWHWHLKITLKMGRKLAPLQTGGCSDAMEKPSDGWAIIDLDAVCSNYQAK